MLLRTQLDALLKMNITMEDEISEMTTYFTSEQPPYDKLRQIKLLLQDLYGDLRLLKDRFDNPR